MGRSPVASGSRVPPWPALAAWNRRRTAPTAWVEVMPAGLSRTSQPSTFSPRRLAAIGLVLLGEIADDAGATQQHLDAVRLAEGPVGLEADGGCDPEIDGIGQRLAEIARGVIEATGQRLGIAAPEGQHEGGGGAEIGADPHLGHRHLDAG